MIGEVGQAGPPLLGAALLGMGVALLVPPRTRGAVPDLEPPGDEASDGGASSSGRLRDWLLSHPRVASILVGAALTWVVGGVLGVFVGGLVAGGLPRLLRRIEHAEQRDRLAAVTGQAPLVADLLAACLSSGATVPAALRAVAAAIEPPCAQILFDAHRIIDLGGLVAEAASALRSSGLGAVAEAIERSAASGAPVAEVLAGEAERLRESARTAAIVRARSVAVRSVLPLALCFLPAFLVLGVVPVIIGLAGQMIPGALVPGR